MISFSGLLKDARSRTYLVICLAALTWLISLNNSFLVYADEIAPLPEVNGDIAGGLAGKVEVSDLGALHYSIPLAVPPGINGMEPTLSVTYSGTKGDGLLGTGWTVSGFSAISRCPATTLLDGFADPVNFNASDRFCLDGQRLMVVSGVYGANLSEYRTELESFSKVVAHGQSGSGPTSFTVYSKDGKISEFGATSDSRMQLEGVSSVSAWMISSVSDRQQNRIEFSYSYDSASQERLPARIDYTVVSVVPSSLRSSVRFEYEDRPWPHTRYVSGAFVSARKRLSRVTMWNGEVETWHYQFGYLNSQYAKSDRLQTITECGADGLCLPATQFGWASEPINGQIQSVTQLPDIGTMGFDQGFNNTVVGDWDGDGKVDLGRSGYVGVYLYRSTGNNFEFYRNLVELGDDTQCSREDLVVGDWNGDGRTDFARSCSYGYVRFYLNLPSGFSYYADIPGLYRSYPRGTDSNAYPYLVGDWNGDGRTDIARVNDTGINFYTSTGSGFSSWLTLTNLSPAQGFPNSLNAPVVVGDWNGDGYTDIARLKPSTSHAGSGIIYPFISLNNSWSALPTFSTYNVSTGEVCVPLFVGDWNGDGLSDIGAAISSGASAISFYTSSGSDFEEYFSTGFYSPVCPFPIYVADWNGDGVSDVAQLTYNTVRIQTVRDRNLYQFAEYSNIGGIGNYSAGAFPVIAGDWSGDGIPDFARFFNNYTRPINLQTSQPLRLEHIWDGLGGETQISYKTLTDPTIYTKGAGGTYPTIELQPPTEVVSSVGVVNSIGTVTNSQYAYNGMRFELNGRGLSGFASIASTETTRGITNTTYYRQDYPFTGLTDSTIRTLSNGTVISRRTEHWTNESLSNGRQLVHNDSSTEEHFDLDGSLITRQTSAKTFDAYGNPLTELTTDDDGYSQLTTHQYQMDLDHWLLGQLIRTEVTASAPGRPSITRTVAFVYSSSTSDYGGNLLTQEITEPNHPEFSLVKSYSYDLVGNRIQSQLSGQDIETQVQILSYDPSFRFVTSITNPLQQVVYQEFDPRNGKLISTTDPNNLVTQQSFDVFGRPTYVRRPDGTEARNVYFKSPPQNSLGSSYFVRTDSSGQPPVIIYFDSLGREIRKETIGFDGRSIYVDHVYNEIGQVTHSSDPYFADEVPQWQVSEYDNLDRVTRIIEPGNKITSFEYQGLLTTVIDPLQAQTTTVRDPRGHIVSVTDDRGGVLRYEYDSYGNAISVTDQLGNTTSAIFDLRGNRIELNDPDSGTTQSTYDALNRLRTLTNAKQEVQEFSYDTLNRTIQLSTPEGVSNWVYDSAPNGISKLTSVTGPGGIHLNMSYDELSRTIGETHTIAGATYSISTIYDQYSRPARLSYPNGYKVYQVYNSTGYLSEVRNADNDSLIWQEQGINARGQSTVSTFGNGVRTTRNFDNLTGLIQGSQSIHVSSNRVLQDTNYNFDALGNLIRRADVRLNLEETFEYDSLSRLIHSTVQGAPTVDYNYDEIGNFTSRSDVGQYLYGDHGPHAVTGTVGARTNTYTYDLTGNRISEVGSTMSYRSDNRLSQVTKGNSLFKYEYTPDGELALQKKFIGGSLAEQKTSIAGFFEREDIGTTRKETVFISGSDGVIALLVSRCGTSGNRFCNYSPRAPDPVPDSKQVAALSTFTSANIQPLKKAGLFYLLKDHLGSISAITNAAGQVVEYFSYDPWGLRRDPTTWLSGGHKSSIIDRGFTGHEQIEELGLIHMNSRMYDPEIGRFLSPDSVVQLPYNMQSFNHYAYVLNNPLSYTDPTGHFGKRFWKRLRRLFRTAVVAAVAIYVGPHVFAALGGTSALTLNSAIAAALSGAASSVASGIASAIVYGYSISDGIYGGFRGSPSYAARSLFDWGIGGLFDVNSKGPLRDYTAFKPIAHGVSNGVVSAIGGTRFYEGFVAGALGSYGGQVGGLPGAILGGATSSAITGGKFADGILQGSFVYLFNDLAHEVGDYLKHLNDIFGESGSFKLAIHDVSDQYKKSAFYDAAKDYGGVLLDFPTNHPTYTTTVQVGALLLTFGEGAFLMAGLKIPQALDILSTSFGTGAAVLEGLKDRQPWGSWSDIASRGLNTIVPQWVTRASGSAAAGRVFQGMNKWYLDFTSGVVSFAQEHRQNP